MAEETMTLLDALRKGEEPAGDFLRDAVRWLLQELMEGEVSAQIGAERYERSEERTTHRNGYRRRPWDTRLGSLELAIPKLRSGSYFPGWLEPRRRAEQALVAVIAEAYVQGVSTRKVEALVQSLGIMGISKSEVSRLCAVLDDQARVFRTRRLDAEYPYLWQDARYEHVREAGRVRSMAVILAYGVRADGVREVLGLEVGLSEDVALWRAFLQDLVARGVRGVQLVTSDAHPGLKQAIAEVFVGASWQRCKVHFVRNLLARVPKAAQSMVAATVRTVFEQPDRQAAGHRLRYVCTTLEARFPAVVQLLEDAEGEILTFYDFPVEHRRAVASTNPLERLNRELKRRSAVVGIFPNRTAVLRLFSALLAEQNDEWLVGHQYMSRGSLRQLRPADGAAAPQATNDLKDTDEREATTPAA
ncbi:MAG TPA: IS256 family transposase [Chloroflexota bacterium]|nr:IS256 family transposase [Chloroflexota bacterium]